jgi:hypothetical protein
MAAAGQSRTRGPAVARRKSQNRDVDTGRIVCGPSPDLEAIAPLPYEWFDPARVTMHDHNGVEGRILGEDPTGPATYCSQPD